GSGRKYPFDPFYGGFNPRLAVAWTPNFKSGLLGAAFGENKTVIRGGYSRIYGRLDGGGLGVGPFVGTGVPEAVFCGGAGSAGGSTAVSASALSAPIRSRLFASGPMGWSRRSRRLRRLWRNRSTPALAAIQRRATARRWTRDIGPITRISSILRSSASWFP